MIGRQLAESMGKQVIVDKENGAVPHFSGEMLKLAKEVGVKPE